MPEKSNSPKKEKSKKSSKPKFTSTIGAALTLSLLFTVTAVMLVCFTISVTSLNSVKKNALERFYANTFESAIQKKRTDIQLKIETYQKKLKLVDDNPDLVKEIKKNLRAVTSQNPEKKKQDSIRLMEQLKNSPKVQSAPAKQKQEMIELLDIIKEDSALITNTAVQEQERAELANLLELMLKKPLLPVLDNKDLAEVRREMNKMLSLRYQISEIYIAEEDNKNLEQNLTTLNRTSPMDRQTASDIENIIVKEKQQSAVYKDTNNLNIIEIPQYEDAEKTKISYTVYLILAQKTIYEDSLISSLAAAFFVIALICIICVPLLVRSIIKPLNTMEETVFKMAKGDLSVRLEYTKYDEINKLTRSYNMMANSLQKLYSSLEAQVNDRTHELKKAYAELQSTQAMMVHSEKMKSLGELVAGIMHEINNPINFIYGNMTHLGNYSHDLIEIIDEYSKYDASLKDTEKDKIYEMKNTCDYDFLRTDMPDLIKSCKEGAERAKNIIQDLKSFSRMEEVSIRDVDIPAEIDTVLNILHNKIKNKAEVHKIYMDNVPKVEAFGGQLNQVFMNILDNAAGAIEKTGDIWIRINTDKDKKNLIIEIEDNGSGMDPETARKVFDPFFTTKPVGKGTGLGMSITYKIVKNHQGDIRVESEKGKGAKFIVTLPLNIDRESLKASAGEDKNNG